MKYCFGVDIGGTTVKLGLFTFDGSLLSKWEIPTDKSDNGGNVLRDVASSIKDKMKENSIELSDLIGIGMGVPGPVGEDGTVYRCVNLGWGIMNVAEEMKKFIPCNVVVGNDANVAALGEAWQGGGKGYDNVVMVTLGTGVGGGIILGGKILTGTKGAAGEIGHILVNYEEEETCGCGKKGCLEQYASATGIVTMAHRLLKATTEPSRLRDLKEITAKDVCDLAKEGDQLASKLVHELCRYLGIALSHVSAVVDPQAFVIGGGVSRAGNILTDLISEYYDSYVMLALKNKVFCLAELGNDAGIYGSAKLALGK